MCLFWTRIGGENVRTQRAATLKLEIEGGRALASNILVIVPPFNKREKINFPIALSRKVTLGNNTLKRKLFNLLKAGERTDLKAIDTTANKLTKTLKRGRKGEHKQHQKNLSKADYQKHREIVFSFPPFSSQALFCT